MKRVAIMIAVAATLALVAGNSASAHPRQSDYGYRNGYDGYRGGYDGYRNGYDGHRNGYRNGYGQSYGRNPGDSYHRGRRRGIGGWFQSLYGPWNRGYSGRSQRSHRHGRHHDFRRGY